MKSLAFIGILVTISLASCPIWKCSTERREDTCWYIKQHEKEQTQKSEVDQTTQGEATSVEATSNQTTSSETATNQTAPVETPSNQTTSNETATNQTTPVETPSNQTTSSETATNQTAPAEPSSNQTTQGETTSSEATSNQTTSNENTTESAITVQTLSQVASNTQEDEREKASQIDTKVRPSDLDEKDEVHVGPFCTDKAKGSCYISDWNDKPQGTNCSYPTEQSGFIDQVHISRRLSQRYCNDVKYKKQFNCEKYCIVHYEANDIYTFRFKDCNITMVQQDRQEHNSLRNVDWSGCRVDGDCASNLCVCVPNTNGQGRCTVSVYDKFYNNAFQTICDETRASDEFLHDMEEDSCALWILLKLGHHIKAVRAYQKVLPCLGNFTDFNNLMTLKDQLSEPFQGKYILLPIGAVIILAFVAYCYCKNRNKDEKAEPLLSSQTAKE